MTIINDVEVSVSIGREVVITCTQNYDGYAELSPAEARAIAALLLSAADSAESE